MRHMHRAWIEEELKKEELRGEVVHAGKAVGMDWRTSPHAIGESSALEEIKLMRG